MTIGVYGGNVEYIYIQNIVQPVLTFLQQEDDMLFQQNNACLYDVHAILKYSDFYQLP